MKTTPPKTMKHLEHQYEDAFLMYPRQDAEALRSLWEKTGQSATELEDLKKQLGVSDRLRGALSASEVEVLEALRSKHLAASSADDEEDEEGAKLEREESGATDVDADAYEAARRRHLAARLRKHAARHRKHAARHQETVNEVGQQRSRAAHQSLPPPSIAPDPLWPMSSYDDEPVIEILASSSNDKAGDEPTVEDEEAPEDMVEDEEAPEDMVEDEAPSEGAARPPPRRGALGTERGQRRGDHHHHRHHHPNYRGGGGGDDDDDGDGVVEGNAEEWAKFWASAEARDVAIETRERAAYYEVEFDAALDAALDQGIGHLVVTGTLVPTARQRTALFHELQRQLGRYPRAHRRDTAFQLRLLRHIGEQTGFGAVEERLRVPRDARLDGATRHRSATGAVVLRIPKAPRPAPNLRYAPPYGHSYQPRATRTRTRTPSGALGHVLPFGAAGIPAGGFW